MHLVYLPKFCITIVFDFSWADCNSNKIYSNILKENLINYARIKTNDCLQHVISPNTFISLLFGSLSRVLIMIAYNNSTWKTNRLFHV